MITLRNRPVLLGLTLLLVTSAALSSQEASTLNAEEGFTIFEYDFESCNTLGWDDRQPPLTPPDAFRIIDLKLRDPHVFVEVAGFGCLDFTDDELPMGLAPSFNQLLQDSIESDAKGDGLLDLNEVYVFRPLDESGVDERIDQGPVFCTAPLETTACDWDETVIPKTTTYDTLLSGTCLEALPGTTSGYSPGVAPTPAPCAITQPESRIVNLGALSGFLQDTQFSGSFVGSPVFRLDSGLFVGFLSVASANAAIISDEVPFIGGQPLSVLLPGGAGNCAPGDDRDGGGWWLYFEHISEKVPFVGD